MDLERASRTYRRTILDTVENEELGFRTEVGGVAQAGRLQVGFGALGDGARVAVVTRPSVGSRRRR